MTAALCLERYAQSCHLFKCRDNEEEAGVTELKY